MTFKEIDLTNSPLIPPEGWAALRIPPAFVPMSVSVVLPTFNRAAFIVEAIDSVWRQTYRPIELLIVDDGSIDNTDEVVRTKLASLPVDREFQAAYIRQPNRGASAARNQGLLHSHGEFIQYLDSDDVLVCKKLEYHVQILHRNAPLDTVWSDWWVVPSDQIGWKLNEANQMAASAVVPDCPLTNRMIPWEPWPTLTRRRFVAAHPLWNEHTSRWDDWEYALRLLAKNPTRTFSPGICCVQREHEQGRRQDFDFDPAGVEKGFEAARQAGAARNRDSEERPDLDQLVADRYWDLFIEALHHGLPDRASEAITGACRFGRRAPFRVKVSLLRIFLHLSGVKTTRVLLRRRYLPNLDFVVK